MNLRALKYRAARWLRLHFAPPRYFVATYGDMGLEVEFYRNPDLYEEACVEAEAMHNDDTIDTWTCGDIE